MTTSPSSAAPSLSSSNGESLSSLPRWRQLLSMLNWRRDPDYERRMLHFEQRKMQHEWRMNQLAKDIERIEKETKQIERETEQLRQETAWLRQQNARGRQLLASIDALCFPPESSSTPAPTTEPASSPTSP
jgi:septal ring factor EnvC (AmiA/AmiB activator)